MPGVLTLGSLIIWEPPTTSDFQAWTLVVELFCVLVCKLRCCAGADVRDRSMWRMCCWKSDISESKSTWARPGIDIKSHSSFYTSLICFCTSLVISRQATCTLHWTDALFSHGSVGSCGRCSSLAATVTFAGYHINLKAHSYGSLGDLDCLLDGANPC